MKIYSKKNVDKKLYQNRIDHVNLCQLVTAMSLLHIKNALGRAVACRKPYTYL